MGVSNRLRGWEEGCPLFDGVVSVWKVECSSCRAQGKLAARNGAGLRRWRVGDCSRARASTEARTIGKWGKKNHETGSVCNCRIHTALYDLCQDTRSSE